MHHGGCPCRWAPLEGPLDKTLHSALSINQEGHPPPQAIRGKKGAGHSFVFTGGSPTHASPAHPFSFMLQLPWASSLLERLAWQALTWIISDLAMVKNSFAGAVSIPSGPACESRAQWLGWSWRSNPCPEEAVISSEDLFLPSCKSWSMHQTVCQCCLSRNVAHCPASLHNAPSEGFNELLHPLVVGRALQVSCTTPRSPAGPIPRAATASDWPLSSWPRAHRSLPRTCRHARLCRTGPPAGVRSSRWCSRRERRVPPAPHSSAGPGASRMHRQCCWNHQQCVESRRWGR